MVDTKLMKIAAMTGFALGGQAKGTARHAASTSRLDEYPLDASHQNDHIEAMAKAPGHFGKTARQAIADSEEVGDADTAGLFTEVSRGVDQYLWMVEAYRAP